MKAILVIEMPENCFKCKLQDWVNCRIVKGCHTGDTRPNWCPLKPIPSKRPTIGKESDNDILCMNAGYNACIDEILGYKE